MVLGHDITALKLSSLTDPSQDHASQGRFQVQLLGFSMT